jgi:hypothetical protein
MGPLPRLGNRLDPTGAGNLGSTPTIDRATGEPIP